MRSLRSHDTLVKIRLMDKHTISCSHTSRITSSASFQIPPTGTYSAFPSHLSDRNPARAIDMRDVRSCKAVNELRADSTPGTRIYPNRPTDWRDSARLGTLLRQELKLSLSGDAVTVLCGLCESAWGAPDAPRDARRAGRAAPWPPRWASRAHISNISRRNVRSHTIRTYLGT